MVLRSWAVLLGLALLSTALLSGCTGGDEAGEDHGGVGSSGEGEGGTGEGWGEGWSEPSAVVEAPVLEVGDSWSYVTDGMWNEVQEVTIVVAEHDGTGTLLAALDSPQLMDEVAWDVPYLGWLDERMRPLRDEEYGGDLHGARLLDFPLEPGKSWDFWGVQVTAEPVDLNVLGDDMEGWRISGEDEDRRVLVEYAPQVGFITFFEEYDKGLDRASWSLEITGTGSGSNWVFFERADEVIAGAVVDPDETTPVVPPEVLEVAEEDDLVFFWALATEGSVGSVTPPPGGPVPWTFEGEGVPHVKTASFEAVPGDWSVTGVAPDPEGWVYIQGHALRFFGPE